MINPTKFMQKVCKRMKAYNNFIFFLSLIIPIFFESFTALTAAEFQIIKPSPAQQNTMVLVIGELLPNDNKRFIAATIDIDNAIVVFSSNGGNLIAGLEIGKAIRLKDFSTYVPANTMCASACAIAWVGGTQRFMSRSAMIGFHAAYVNNQSGPAETGVGNALVGAYFNSLGLPNRAVAYMTVASPESMQWLSYDDAQKLGLNVSIFDVAPSSSGSSKTSDGTNDPGKFFPEKGVKHQRKPMMTEEAIESPTIPRQTSAPAGAGNPYSATINICRPPDPFYSEIYLSLGRNLNLTLERNTKFEVTKLPEKILMSVKSKGIAKNAEPHIQLDLNSPKTLSSYNENYLVVYFSDPDSGYVIHGSLLNRTGSLDVLEVSAQTYNDVCGWPSMQHVEYGVSHRKR